MPLVCLPTMTSLHLHLHLQFGEYKPDWGDVPTWLAAFFALAAGIVALGIYSVERERDREKEKAERRAQAEKIAAWFGSVDDPEPPYETFCAYVRNSSDLPVFDVHPGFQSAEDGEPDPEGWVSFAGSLAVLPPQSTKTVDIGLTEEEYEHIPEHLREGMFLIELEFRDAAGVRWRRDVHGHLTEDSSATSG